MEAARPSPARQQFAAIAIGAMAALTSVLPTSYGLVALGALASAALFWWTGQNAERWLGVFFLSALLLPPINLPFGNSGPHPSLVIVAIGLWAGLVRIRDWSTRWHPLSTTMVALLGVLLATVPMAALYSGPEVATGSFVRVLLLSIAVYVYFYLNEGPLRFHTISTMAASKYLLWIATAVAAFACIDFYYQFPAPAGFGPQFVWLDSGVFRRAQGLFYEASTLGNFCAFFLVMIMAALFSPKEQRPAGLWTFSICGMVLATALVLSYSRGSLINLTVAAVALLALRRERVKIGTLLKSSLVMAATGIAVLWALFPTFAQSYWTRLVLSMEYFYSSPNGVLSGRLQNWDRLLEFLSEHPWTALFGIGYKTIPYSSFIGDRLVADNMYLSLLIETGVVGLAVFALLNYRILQAVRIPARRTFVGAWFFSFWTGELVQMLSGDLLTYWRVMPVYFFVLALAVRER